MTCKVVTLPNGSTALVKLATPRPRRCAHCDRRARKLCDYVIYPMPLSNPARGPRTCDKPLCDMCAVRVGPNVDYCPDHPIAPEAA
jgi:hypothetical protein